MILAGQPAMFGVTFSAPGLRVGARVFDSAGAPVGAWALMSNYDGNSYQLPITIAVAGSYSVKKVVFDNADVDFTVRDPGYPEAEDAVQAVVFPTLSDNTQIVQVQGLVAYIKEVPPLETA